MAMFITRVELHGASEQDYQVLHAAMDSENFSRTITANNGVRYQLPTGEYVSFSSTLDADGVMTLAKRAANTTGRTSWVLTSRANACRFDLPLAPQDVQLQERR
jgi:hypothetical protein